MSLAGNTGAVPVHCTAAYSKCSPSPSLRSIDLGVCVTVNLTLRERCGIQSRIGTPKCLYPGTITGSSSCGGQLPAPSWTTCELCSLVAVGSLCSEIMWFERADLAHSHVLEFVLLSFEKIGGYIGLRQMKEHNLALKTGMGSISYLSR